jgi:hypothetical protein
MQRRALLLGSSALLWSCGPRARPTLPSAPRVVSSEDLLPADLDVVVRVDLGKMKATLGAITEEVLSRDALTAGVASDERPEPVLVASLLAAERVYLAYRPSPLLLPTDRVLIVEGRFDPFVSPPPGFTLATDLGADLRYWDRKPGARLPRSGIARIYAQGQRLLAFVSEAELDAVERTLTTPSSPRQLRPPAEGAISLAMRPALLAKLASGTLRDLLERAQSLQLVGDLQSDRARVRAALVLASADDAQALQLAAQHLLERLPSELRASASLQAEQERLVLEATLTRSQLLPVLACLGRGSGAACPW